MLKRREWVKKLCENMGNLFKKIDFRDLLIKLFCTSLAIVSVLIFIIPFLISRGNSLEPTHEETKIAELIPIPDVDTLEEITTEALTEVESTTCAQEKETIQQETTTEFIETTTIIETTSVSTLFTANKDVEFYLSDEERRIVECVVMGESGGEIYKGQVLVAQCILNACLKEGRQPSDIRKMYQYAGWKNNPSESVKKAVSAVFDKGYKVTTEPILYFYAPKWCNGEWHETQRFVMEVGAHRFFAQW